MRRFIGFGILSVGVLLSHVAFASPQGAFGNDARSVARAGAVVSSVEPHVAAAVNPARLIMTRGIELSLGLVVAEDEIRVQKADADLDTYVGYSLGTALMLPLGRWRDRLFAGVTAHLPHKALYEVRNTAQSDVVVLNYGDSARRFSLDAALAVRIWENYGIGVGLHIMPDVVADVDIDFVSDAQNSQSHVVVDYKFAPSIGFYGQINAIFRLGLAYKAATRLTLDVPANVRVSDSIGQIHTQLKGYAYAEPHDFSVGLTADLSSLSSIDWAKFALHASANFRYNPHPIATSAVVTLYDDNGAVLNESHQNDADFDFSYALHFAIDWMIRPEIGISAGYAFEKTAIPAQRTVFNVLDADKNQIAFGFRIACPESWFSPLGIEFQSSVKFDLLDTRDVEKYVFLVGNPGFPAIRLEGWMFSWHGALVFRFE